MLSSDKISKAVAPVVKFMVKCKRWSSRDELMNAVGRCLSDPGKHILACNKKLRRDFEKFYRGLYYCFICLGLAATSMLPLSLPVRHRP
jgi:hypothetical protein